MMFLDDLPTHSRNIKNLVFNVGRRFGLTCYSRKIRKLSCNITREVCDCSPLRQDLKLAFCCGEV